MRSDFAAFILTNGRPDKVLTYHALRYGGYTGPIYLLVDDLDPTRGKYIENYGDQVIVFDKRAIGATFDKGDNLPEMRSIIFARNACWQIARERGARYFIQLDDDYSYFEWRFRADLTYGFNIVRAGLDDIFETLVKFYISSGASALAMAQGGDYLGGPSVFGKFKREKGNPYCERVLLLRKVMNTWILSIDRPFQFIGKWNEDVNTYVHHGSVGKLMITTNQLSIKHTPTQQQAGGVTEVYKSQSAYVKPFFSVMYHPSGVKVKTMQSANARIHHAVNWKHTVPKIVRESLRKTA